MILQIAVLSIVIHNKVILISAEELVSKFNPYGFFFNVSITAIKAATSNGSLSFSHWSIVSLNL